MLLASYALLFAAGAYGIERASVRLAGRKAGVAIATAAMLALVGITGAFSVLRARDWAARSSDWIVAARAEHHRILHEIVGPHAPARVMALDVHQLHANTGLPLVVIPYESEPVIHATALRLGVTHLLMRGAPERTGSGRSGLAEIPSRPSRWQQVESRAIGNDTVRLYRVVPPQ
jgi:hypothetical protein